MLILRQLVIQQAFNRKLHCPDAVNSLALTRFAIRGNSILFDLIVCLSVPHFANQSMRFSGTEADAYAGSAGQGPKIHQ